MKGLEPAGCPERHEPPSGDTSSGGRWREARLDSVEVVDLKLQGAAQTRDARLKVSRILKEWREGRGRLDGALHSPAIGASHGKRLVCF
jgi:hypothetical protein